MHTGHSRWSVEAKRLSEVLVIQNDSVGGEDLVHHLSQLELSTTRELCTVDPIFRHTPVLSLCASKPEVEAYPSKLTA